MRHEREAEDDNQHGDGNGRSGRDGDGVLALPRSQGLPVLLVCRAGAWWPEPMATGNLRCLPWRRLGDGVSAMSRPPTAAERLATCGPGCLSQDGIVVHSSDCPTVAALRAKPGISFWFEKRDCDPAGDAVRELLKPGEHLDERRRIRKVQ